VLNLNISFSNAPPSPCHNPLAAIAMKTFILISTILFVYSCNETNTNKIEATNNGRTWNISLADNLGNLQIILPKYFDTSFSWTQYSDCGDGCAKSDYRVQSKLLPIFKDNGFIYFPLKDSVEQFTIKHPKRFSPWPFNDTSLVRQYLGRLKSEAYENSSNKFDIDTVLTIGTQHFGVIAFTSFDTTKKVKIQILNAMTSIKGNIVELFFEYRKSYSDTLSKDFIKNSFDALKTIRISNGS
jgi:hypothetical protein